VTTATGTASCAIPLAQPLGPVPVAAAFAGNDAFLASTTSGTILVFAYASGGAFVVGDQTSGASPVRRAVTFSGPQWAGSNRLSHGPAPDAFKGFENSTARPACDTSWTTGTGNSVSPPPTVPAYTAVAVSSTITGSTSRISGDTVDVVVVRTDLGYAPN